jgi:hypothetical protein
MKKGVEGGMKRSATLRGPRTIVLSAVALVAFPAGSIAIAPILGELEWRVLLVGLCTSVLSVWVIRNALRRGSAHPGAATAACFGFSMLAAVLNAPLSLTAVGFSLGEPEAVLILPAAVIFATLFGMVITVPLGLLFATAYAILVTLTHRACTHRSTEGRDVALRTSGIWLVAVNLLSLVVLSEATTARFASTFVFAFLTGACAVSLVVGTVAVLWAHINLWRRRNWLGRVMRGRVDGWAVVSLTDLDEQSMAELPTLLLEDVIPTGVLMHRGLDVGGGAYRQSETYEPVSLI